MEITDGTAEYNDKNYRLSLFYDLAKTSLIRMAWALAQELQPHQCTAFALTPGWLRSEMMLDHFGVSEANSQDATAKEPHFIISETPRYIGRAVACLAGDPHVAAGVVSRCRVVNWRRSTALRIWMDRSLMPGATFVRLKLLVNPPTQLDIASVVRGISEIVMDARVCSFGFRT